MKLAVALLSVFLLCIGQASAEEFVEQSTQIRFPEVIAIAKNDPPPANCSAPTPALCRGPVTRYPDPKLGVALSYADRGNLVIASVFVYDYGQPGIPDGPHSQIVQAQYENMKRDISSMESMGNYRNVRMISEDAADALPSIGVLKARAARFSYERDDGKYLSDAYLSALGGKLLKVRVTYRADVSAAKTASDAFMAELGARVTDAVAKRQTAQSETPWTISGMRRLR